MMPFRGRVARAGEVVLLVLLVVLTSVRARAQEPAAPQPTGDTVAPTPESAGPATKLAWEEGVLVGRKDDSTEAWRTWLGNRISEPPPPALVAGERAVACVGATLYSLDRTTGFVQWRRMLPGKCGTMELAGQGVKLSLRLMSNQPMSQDLTVDPANPVLPFYMPAGTAWFHTRKLAQVLYLGDKAETPSARIALLKAPEQRPLVETALEELNRRVPRDTTNPFYDVERGHLLAALGRTAEARAAYEASLAHDEVYDLDLISAAGELDPVAPDLGARAFERGMRALMRSGYEPELAHGVLTLMLTLGRPDIPAEAAARSAALSRRGDRVADLTPQAEGAAWFFEALRRDAIAQGKQEDAARWTKLRDEASSTTFIGPAPAETRYAGHVLNVVLGMSAALVLLGMLMILKSLAWRAPAGTPWWRRYHPAARIGVLQRVGVILGVVVLLAAGSYAAKGIGLLGMLASAPTGLGMGYLGDPESVAYTTEFQGPAGGDLVRGIALQQSGDFDGALEAYRQSGLPEAKVNTGVILAKRGDSQGARSAWESALQAKPGLSEAAFNLGRDAQSTRVDRMRRFGLPGPMLAMPPVEAWHEALRARYARHQPAAASNPVSATLALFTLSDAVAPDGDAPLPSVGITFFALLLTLVIAIGPWTRTAWEWSPSGRSGWALSLIVPGGARGYGPLGVVVAGAFLTMALGAMTLRSTGGVAASVLDAIAIPSFEKYYGASAEFLNAEERMLWPLYQAWWVLVLANVVFVAVTEWRFPDPVTSGQRSAASAKTSR